jgi:hypothetical protein
MAGLWRSLSADPCESVHLVDSMLLTVLAIPCGHYCSLWLLRFPRIVWLWAVF